MVSRFGGFLVHAPFPGDHVDAGVAAETEPLAQSGTGDSQVRAADARICAAAVTSRIMETQNKMEHRFFHAGYPTLSIIHVQQQFFMLFPSR